MVKNKTGFGRGIRIGRLGASLTGSYLAYQLQNLFFGQDEIEHRKRTFQKTTSRRIRKELEELKGPVMKLGQILSMQGQALPPEVIEELAHLQARAPAMHPTLARAQFKAVLGKEPEDVFQTFESEAFAAASLGQVHRATTKAGEKVVVKIQYPAIRTAIENDFRLFRSATFPGRLLGHLPDSILEEAESGFLRETDYEQEADNIEFFREHLAPLEYMRLPRVYREWSGNRVLTMSFVEGQSLGEFMGGKPPRRLRNLIGERLAELYHFECRCAKAIHADPHPGNYLFASDGSIGLVDFGCVKYFSPEFAEIVRCFMGRVWERGEDEYARMLRLTFGKKTSPSNAKAREMLDAAIDFFHVIFPSRKPGETEVNFGDPTVIGRLTEMFRKSIQNKITNPEFVFASRAELGLYNLLHRLEAKVDTAEVMKRVDRLEENGSLRV
ncbi:MAG: AarF/ABC1/UbiB kinase family protein [Verrucomicrobiales bacterium]|nr:AarF/ABC1/UbiB kinase family protein [Verrucomicrobiales bacterium]